MLLQLRRQKNNAKTCAQVRCLCSSRRSGSYLTSQALGHSLESEFNDGLTKEPACVVRSNWQVAGETVKYDRALTFDSS